LNIIATRPADGRDPQGPAATRRTIASQEHEMLLNVGKMTCNHCVRSVTQAVQAVAPAAQVEVDLAQQTVRVQGATDAAAVSKAIEDEGYVVRIVEA
jgi:copper chaperone